MSTSPLRFFSLLATLGFGLACAQVHADGDHELSVGVQRDSQQNQQAAAAVKLPVGQRGWVQVGAGKSVVRDTTTGGSTVRPTQVGVAAGIGGDRWQASVNAGQRRSGSSYRQTDAGATVDVKPVDGVVVGLDGTYRTAKLRTTAPSTSEQRLRGRGVGVHGAVAVTDKFSVQAATLRNHYTTAQASTSAQPGLIGSLLTPPSVVNREEAALDRSSQLGATYRFSRVALTGEVLVDKLHEGGSLHSVQMKAAVPVGAGWTLTPGLGRSRDSQGNHATYGQLGATLAW